MDRLRFLVGRIAEAGRLVVGVETAASMIHASGRGLTLHLIGTSPKQRDLALSRRLREATIGAITDEAATDAPDYARRATALKAVLGETDGLFTSGERALLDELLDRLADAPLPGSN